jgi:transposase
MKVMYERVAGIDVHKDMIKVAIRSPGEKPWTRKTEIFEFRTFYGVLQEMARELRRRGVTHVVMEASGVYTEPVYYALCEQDFTEVAVINPAHAKALKGHKTDAKDCARLAELFECGLLRGSYIPSAEQKEVRDLTRYRMKTVQARTSEIQRLAKALESAGIKLGSVASEITGKSSTAMIESLIDGERRGPVLADLAIGRMRAAGKLTDLSMALAGRFTGHHALLCRLHLDRIAVFNDAVDGLDQRITGKAARWQREAGLLTSVPGFGDVVAQAWLGEIGPAPHRHFATCEKLASWVTLCPGNNISARKRKHGRTGDAGTYIKPMLVQAAWAAIRVRGRLQARYNRLVPAGSAGTRIPARRRRRSPRSRTPCSRSPTRSSRAAPLTPSRARTSTPGGNPRSRSRPGWSASCKSSTPAAPSPSPSARRRPHYQPALKPQARFRQPRSRRRPGTPALPPDKPASLPSPRHRTGQGSLPHAHRGPSYRVRGYEHRRPGFPTHLTRS